MRRSRKRRVDRLEGRNGSAQVEGLATNVTARTTATFERDVDSKRVDGPAEQPCAAEGDEEADARHGRREHERQLDERDEHVPRAASAVRDPVRGRGAEPEDERHRDRVRLRRDPDRVERRAAAECGQQVARWNAQEDGDDRQEQKEQHDAGRRDERRAKEPVYGAAFGIGRKPAFRSARCPRGPSSLLIHALAAGLFADLETTAIS